MSIHAQTLRHRPDDQRREVLDALERAAEPLTRQALVLETHRSKRQVRAALTDLLEREAIRRVRDPDDRRIVRYEPLEVPA